MFKDYFIKCIGEDFSLKREYYFNGGLKNEFHFSGNLFNRITRFWNYDGTRRRLRNRKMGVIHGVQLKFEY